MVEELGADVELISSSGGVYEIVVDGLCVFSKKDLGRFPLEGEVLRLINEAVDS